MENEEYFKKLKKKSKKQNKPLTEEVPIEEKPKVTGVYSFKTYLAMRPLAKWFVLIFFLLFMGFMMEYVGKDYAEPEELDLYDYFFYGTTAMASFIISMILIGYISYRGWIDRLSYKLTGWEELMRKHKLGYRNYTYVKITLHPKPNSTESHPVMIDAMQILFNRVDRINSLKTDKGIKKWEKLTHFMIEGPTNVYGVRRLRKTLRKELNEVNKRLDSIEKIHIFTSAREFEFGYKYNPADYQTP